MLKTASAAIALLALANPAFIDPAMAAACATQSEATALRAAVIQQELMVAALQCRETKAYNRFVMTYRGELQASDATLKTFFIRRGGEHGEAGYDSFKTKAANLSALEQARNAGAFCADARALFASAFANRGGLMSFVQAHAGSTDIGGICTESRPTLAKSTRPGTGQTVKVAETNSSNVGGVPAYSSPAIPYRRSDTVAAAPRIEDEMANSDAYTDEDDVAPPRTPLAIPYQRNDNVAAAPRIEDKMVRDDDKDYAGPSDAAPSGAAPSTTGPAYSAPAYAARSNAAPAYPAPSYAAPSYADEDAPPPPRPRYYDIRQRDYYADRGYGYAPPRSYGPPPDWRRDWRDYPPPPPPRYGWYPAGPYGRW